MSLHIDAAKLREHYAWLSDEALLAIDRTELVEEAQAIYDEEVRQREWERSPEGIEASDPSLLAIDIGPEPDWLEDGACAYRIFLRPGRTPPVAEDAGQARLHLRAAGIPCHIVIKPLNEWDDDSPPRHEVCVMVPGELQLHAASVLDHRIFNPAEEESWRNNLSTLTDEQFKTLDPDIFCAGILDRAERLRRVYNDEFAKRRRDPATA